MGRKKIKGPAKTFDMLHKGQKFTFNVKRYTSRGIWGEEIEATKVNRNRAIDREGKYWEMLGIEGCRCTQ